MVKASVMSRSTWRDHLEQVAAGRPHVVELALHEVVPLLERLELAGGEQVHAPEEPEPPLDELLVLLEGPTVSSSVSSASSLLGVGLEPLAEQALGVTDPALDVAARAVVVLVGLPQLVQARRRLAPRPVGGGLGVGGLALRGRGRLARVVRIAEGLRRRPRRRTPRRPARAARPPPPRLAERDGVVGRELVALAPELGQPLVVRGARVPERLHGDARGDRRDAGAAAARGGRRPVTGPIAVSRSRQATRFASSPARRAARSSSSLRGPYGVAPERGHAARRRP